MACRNRSFGGNLASGGCVGRIGVGGNTLVATSVAVANGLVGEDSGNRVGVVPGLKAEGVES